MSHSVEGQSRFKDWTKGKLTHVTSQLKGLRRFASHVETLVRNHCSSRLGNTEPQLWKLLWIRVVKKHIVEIELCQCIVQQQLLAHPFGHLLISRSLTPKSFAPEPPSSATHFSTIQRDVRAGAIRVEISDPEQWTPGEVAILKTRKTSEFGTLGAWSLRHLWLGSRCGSEVSPVNRIDGKGWCKVSCDRCGPKRE